MESIGKHLRRERELRQVSLEEMAQTTRIPMKMLHRIEEDRFDELPGEVFARGFLRSYTRALGLDSEPVIERYDLGRRRPEEAAPAPIAVITPPERGRRFGIAIALVILLILFTLALSIVLRPRHRDTHIELSSYSLHDFDAFASKSRTPLSAPQTLGPREGHPHTPATLRFAQRRARFARDLG